MILARTSKRDVSEEEAKKPKRTEDKELFEDVTGDTPGENQGEGPEGSGAAEKDSVEVSGVGSEDGKDDSPGDVKEELAAERDKYLRLFAEYDNYRKRSVKERDMIYKDARADTITRLLPVFDNLERALKAECADEAFYKGVEMTMTQLTEIFESLGVKPIPAIGEMFDPNRHNAVMSIENPELGDNVIAEEFQKGFLLGDRVIRFSTVVVAN